VRWPCSLPTGSPMNSSTDVTNQSNCSLCQVGDPGRHPDRGGTHQGRPFRVGDRITYWDQGTKRGAIIRGFEPLTKVVVDIDPPLKGAAGASLGRRIERRNIVKRI